MPDIIGSIGKLFSAGNLGTTLAAGSAGAGEIGNLVSGIGEAKQQSALESQQKKIESLSPADLTRMVTSAEAPINQGLVQSINNSVQGDLASRGLSQAPGIFASEEAQALAPVEQQNYSVALQQVMQQLGLPLQYAAQIQKMFPGATNVTPAMTLLLQQLAKRSGAGGGAPGTLPITPNASTISLNNPPPPGTFPASDQSTGSGLDLDALGVNA